MAQKKGIVAFCMNIVLMLLFANLFFIQSCHATGTTLYVDDSNTAGPWEGTQNFPYRTIHEGIAAASPSDTIFIFSGTYDENVAITKDLTVLGENKDTTFIEGAGQNHVLKANGSDENEIHVIISQLTIRNAFGSGFDCVSLSYATNSEITDSKILNSQEGNGISLVNCHAVTILNNVISNCMTSGLSLSGSNENTIENNIIQNNQKGIHLGSVSSDNHITSNTIRDNSAYGVYVVQSIHNVFSLNDFTGSYHNGNGQNAQDSTNNNNSWSANHRGNYWKDYNNYDSNGDGIGDTPYIIPGGNNNKDEYPLGYFLQHEQGGSGNQQPHVLSLWISKTTANYGDVISFLGEGEDPDGTIAGYSWRSNWDGPLSNNRTFNMSTLSVRTHTIYFKVEDNEGAWSTEWADSITINSRLNIQPIAYIDTITPNPAKQGQNVIFRGRGTDQDGTIIGYRWLSSKNGVIGTTSFLIIHNLSLGNHTIYFQVKDDANEMSPAVTMFLVIEKNTTQGAVNNHLPTVDIRGPSQGIINNAVVFNGSGSRDDDGEIISYVWNYGDGNTGNGVVASHVYINQGTYRVTLTVTDDDDENATCSTSIMINRSASQGNTPGTIAGVNLELPLPVLIGVALISIIGILTGFILRLRRN